MLGGKPTVFVSHSEKYKEGVALPFRDYAEALGMNVILVSEMPTPEHGAAEPDAKIDYYLDRANMFVALMTPDDRTDSGEVHARPNVTDEITRARMRSHLRPRVQVFKAPEVDLHSNINPTYEALDPDDVGSIFPAFERQARAWEVLAAADQAEEPKPAVGPIGPSDHVADGSAVPSKGAVGQVLKAVDGLRDLLTGEPPVDDSDSPSSVARAHLSASVALAAVRSTSSFGVHELNGLYRERELLDLTSDERRFLLRAVLLHFPNENAPGWFWFRGRSATAVHRLVVGFAIGDPDTAVRTQGLRILRASSRELERRELGALMEACAGADQEPSVRSAALELLAERGDVHLVGELGDLLDTPAGAEATLAVRARCAPVAVLREVLDRPSIHSVQVQGALLVNSRKLPTSLLREGLGSDVPAIRRLAMKALDRSSRLRKADVLALIEGEIPADERMAALEAALRRGWSLDKSTLDAAVRDAGFPLGDDHELRIKFHSRRSRDELRDDLKWIGDSPWTLYAALGLTYFEDFADRVREDLDADFESLRTNYRTGVEAAIRRDVEEKVRRMPETERPDAELVRVLVSEGLSDFFKDLDSLESFTISNFQVAALRVLLEHGRAEDADFGRRLIEASSKDVVNASVRLLARFGKPEDANRLIAAAQSLYRDDAVHAAEAALAVSQYDLDTISALIDTQNVSLMKAAIAAMDHIPLEEAMRIVFPLLRSGNQDVRQAGVHHLVRRLDRSQQEDLLDRYVEQGDYYYYDVVVHLDRWLYAPGWVRAAAVDL